MRDRPLLRVVLLTAVAAGVLAGLWLVVGAEPGVADAAAPPGRGAQVADPVEEHDQPGRSPAQAPRQVHSTGKSATEEQLQRRPEFSSRGAKIEGRVLDDMDRPVAGVRVLLVEADRGQLADALVEADGAFSFEPLDSGDYQVRASTDDLPPGLLGPWKQSERTYGPGDAYTAPRVVIPEQGGRFSVELRVYPAALVSGVVLGPGDEPIPGVQVRLQSAATTVGRSSLASDAYTDELGRFEMHDVYPGRFQVQAWPQAAEDESHLQLPTPIPTAIEITAGSFFDLGVIRLGDGSQIVRGRVLDQEGAPFEGLQVVAYPGAAPEEGFMPFGLSTILARATTDSKGWYSLTRLPAAEVKLSFEPLYFEKPLGERVAAFWTPPLLMDLTGAEGTYTAPDGSAQRSHPFRYQGQIELDPQWAAENKFPLIRMRIELQLLDGGAPPIPNRPSFYADGMHFDTRTGELSWICETPHHPVLLRIRDPRYDSPTVEVVITPEPDGLSSEVVRYP